MSQELIANMEQFDEIVPIIDKVVPQEQLRTRCIYCGSMWENNRITMKGVAYLFKHKKQLFHPVAAEQLHPQYTALLQERLGVDRCYMELMYPHPNFQMNTISPEQRLRAF